MSDREELVKLYEDMYSAMITKDRKELERIHDDGFVLVHMTGMHQDKKAYINALLNGTLNYFRAETAKVDTEISGDIAHVAGSSTVDAAVFGGGKHTWRLRLDLKAKKSQGSWRFTGAEASTW